MNTRTGLFAGALAGLLCAPAFSQETHAEHMPGMHMSHETTDTDTPTQSEREHVPPDPPQRELEHPASYRQMASTMEMDDRESLGKVMLDRLDWRESEGTSVLEWDASAWYGGDYNKVWLKTEGERSSGSTDDASVELLWDRIFSRWWSVQTGVRQDFGQGPSRTWAAFGIEGLAPYFFDVEATAYVGEGGRTAARLSSQYDLLLTQRLVLQPQAEANLYGKSDPERGIGSGLSDLQVGLRLRYEFRRELAPYVGIAWTRRFGQSADLARATGEDPTDLQALAGLRIWF